MPIAVRCFGLNNCKLGDVFHMQIRENRILVLPVQKFGKTVRVLFEQDETAMGIRRLNPHFDCGMFCEVKRCRIIDDEFIFLGKFKIIHAWRMYATMKNRGTVHLSMIVISAQIVQAARRRMVRWRVHVQEKDRIRIG